MTNDELTAKDRELATYIGIGLILLIVGILFYLRHQGIIPGPHVIITKLTSWYKQFGYIVVFISALLEGLLLIGFYVPGSTAILLGVILAKSSYLSVPIVVSLAIVGFLISYTIDYCLGRFGLYQFFSFLGYQEIIEQNGANLRKKGWRLIVASLFHPGIGTLLSTGAGVIKMSFYQYFIATLAGLIFWDSLWGFLAYHFGNKVLPILESGWAIPIMLAWLVIALYGPLKNLLATHE